ncbi:hypothetical protein ColLi_12188 [Colletotrichum liriopes]|uniref:Uncharacterized protein n=1 Tax=Colletotrichum liriopes TaxID=708192 RepID=A0AA37LXP7_9PEZI|nr:hypothetical protein ColLi_12188 [Colletotrichum liriopes]
MDVVQCINRGGDWAYEAITELRLTWMHASHFYNNSMCLGAPHWLQSLATALADTPRSSNNDATTTAASSTDTRADNKTDYILTTMLLFLDPGIKHGLLPRSLHQGHAAAKLILPNLETPEGEIERLVKLAKGAFNLLE